MRGAVSVALVYLYYDPDGTTSDMVRSSLISMTLTVVLFSTLVYGAITKPMLDFLLGAEGESPPLPAGSLVIHLLVKHWNGLHTIHTLDFEADMCRCKQCHAERPPER